MRKSRGKEERKDGQEKRKKGKGEELRGNKYNLNLRVDLS